MTIWRDDGLLLVSLAKHETWVSITRARNVRCPMRTFAIHDVREVASIVVYDSTCSVQRSVSTSDLADARTEQYEEEMRT